MFKFVDSEVHPRFKAMTELFRRLERQSTAAAEASANEKRCHKELADLKEDQLEAPRYPFPEGGYSSFEEDFTDPGWSGRSPKCSERSSSYASALLDARARYVELYDTGREMQLLLGNYREAFFELRDTDKVPAWQMELLDHDFICCCELFKATLETLASFSDMVGVNWHDECPLTSFSARREIDAFRGQWSNWFGALPMLPEVATCDDRREGNLLVLCLAVRDQADRQAIEPMVIPHDHVSLRGKQSAVQRLTDAGWRASLETQGTRTKVSVSRARNKHAPYIRPIEAPRRRFGRRC